MTVNWLCLGLFLGLRYSGNFAKDWNEEKILENPPERHYGIVFQEI